jgi:hypothetical protein
LDTHDKKPETEKIAEVEVKRSPFDTFGVAIFLVVLVQIVILIGLNLYQKSRAASLSAQLNGHRTTLASPGYVELNTQLEEVLSGQRLLQETLAGKVKWSLFYHQLNAVTPKNVKVNSVQVGANGTFRLEGETPTLASLAQALVAWQKGTAAAPTPFANVKLNSNGYANDGNNRVVSFSVSGSLNIGGLK